MGSKKYVNKQLNVQNIRKIQLRILNSVHEFCCISGIDYFLSYGSLIGAIRHNGYIPWDDDIDICMTRPNYDRFIQEFNKSKSEYFCACYELDHNFPYTFAKVIDNSTLLIEASRIKYRLGVNIDVLPIDGINNDLRLLKRQENLRMISDAKTIRLSNERSIIKNIFLLIARFLTAFIPHKQIIRRMVNNAKTHDYSLSQNVCCVAYGSDVDKPFPRADLEPLVLHKFEDREYFIPVEYDRYLRSIYGDYMLMPPENERVTHHDFKAYIT